MEAFKNENSIKITIQDLDFSFSKSDDKKINVIEGLNLCVYDQEFLSIVGTSGCGKSTLLNIIAGLLPVEKGSVFLGEHQINGPGPDRTMVFQDDAVFPWYTVEQNIEYGLKISCRDKAQRKQEVAKTLELVGLTDSAKKFPRELSGGMRKRVDVARAIITKPEVLLMDEPFAALDVMTKQRLQDKFLSIWNETRMTVIFVTHDLEEALYLADRVIVMQSNPGKIARIVQVPMERPRNQLLKTTTEFTKMRRELSLILDSDNNQDE